MRVFVIIQARLNSSRLPGKIFYKLANKTVIEWCIYRSKKVSNINGVMIVSPNDTLHRPLKSYFNELNCEYFLGDEKDVLSRYYYGAKSVNADIIIRITSDCPLVDPTIVDSLYERMKNEKLDFITNMAPPSWPHGLDVSIFNIKTLSMAHKNAKSLLDREHVVPWMWKNSEINNKNIIKGKNISLENVYNNHRWTIDTINDYCYFKKLELFFGDKIFKKWNWQTAIKNINSNKLLLDDLNEIRDINYWKKYIEEKA